MCKRFYTVISSVLALSISAMFLLTACSGRETERETVVSPAAVTDSEQGNPLQLVWLTQEGWAEKMTGRRLGAVNQRIHELGYDCEVVFEGINEDTYDDYQQGITKAKENGRGDLMWTGYGDGDNPDAEGTYYRQIRLGNLLPLDDWLQTDMGKTLEEKYSTFDWERVTYKNKIYGVSNTREPGAFFDLLLTGDQMQEGAGVLKGKADITIDELCEWMEEYRKDPEHRFYLNWRYGVGDEWYESFCKIGYIRLCDGVYMTSEGNVVNVWEREEVCRFWTCLAKMEQTGQLECDDSDGLGEVQEGKYPAAFVTMGSEITDGSYLYQEDGSRVPAESHFVAAAYLNHMENSVHGVTSWSRHPEEAMQLLTLVNTDETLANLLCFGEEGTDYEKKEGKVFTYSPYEYCPANPRITYPDISEVTPEEGKEAYYKKANERYSFSPAEGFVPDLKKAGADSHVLQKVERFYKKLLKGDGEPEQMIRNFQKELRDKKYGEVLEKIQRQYDKWKKGKKHED